MQDIRQSTPFTGFMSDLGWETKEIDSQYIYLRKFPILGYFAKIPRPVLPIDPAKIIAFKKLHKIFRLKISPFTDTDDKNYEKYQQSFLKAGFKIDKSPFNPTTNYLIDLSGKVKDIFNNFSEAKRRGVRRAVKNGIVVKETADLPSFIEIRKKQYFPVGFLVTGEMTKLWENFYPENASLLLAYKPENHKAVAGIFLLFFDNVAYYWFASALPDGKKLFAPTLLVWEAIKVAKKRGCKIFDFEGIYDERFPQASQSWKGFTKFKEGFGVKKVVYMENFQI